MSEKRFIDGGKECIEDQFLIDTLTDKYYWIDNGLDDIVNMLNALHEENEKLRKVEMLANHRGEMIGFANALIDDLGSQTMKEMWDKFKNGKYEKWCELE